MNIVPFARITVLYQHRVTVGLGRHSLLFSQSGPCGTSRIVRRQEVGKFHYIERQTVIGKQLSPVLHHRSQQSGILAPSAHVRFALIPYHTAEPVITERMHHPVKEPSRHVLQRCRRWPLRHLCPRAMFPFAFQTYLTSAAYQLVRLFLHERRTSAVAEQTYRNLVSALTEHTCRHLIYTWRILIARAAHQAAVHIHRIRVHHASQAQHRLHGAASRRHVYLPAEPVRTVRSPSVACSPPSV